MKDRPAPADIDAAREARLLARAASSGALATLRRARSGGGQPGAGGGQPYVSKVGAALDSQGRPIFLFSTLAAHTQDLLADGRCSLLVEGPSQNANPLEAARATLVGVARRLEGDEAHAARDIYLARHPGAARYVDFGDFAFWRLDVQKVHFVGGFGIAKWVKAEAYLAPPGTLAGTRMRLLDELNGVKQNDLAQASGLKSGWRAVDVDPDGVTLAGTASRKKGRLTRLNFATPAKNARSWRARFSACVKRAAPHA